MKNNIDKKTKNKMENISISVSDTSIIILYFLYYLFYKYPDLKIIFSRGILCLILERVGVIC